MGVERFAKLAEELAARDCDLPGVLAEARAAAERLRGVARAALEAFCRTAEKRGADHLASVELSDVLPDEKHVDCLQFAIARGRWQLTCVIKAGAGVTLVGPFRTGKPEKPCSDFPARGDSTERGLEDAIEALIRAAAER